MADCLFCKIINHEIPSEIVFEDDLVIAFKDINPLAPVHLLVVPKKHIQGLNDIIDQDEVMLGHLLRDVKKLAQEFNIAESGYRVVANTGSDGGQIIGHLHFHLIGGQALGSKLG